MDFLRNIFKRYRSNQSDEQEKQLVDVWYDATGRFPLPKEMTSRKHLARSEEHGWQAVMLQLALDTHAPALNTIPAIRRLPLLMRYAAVFLLLGGSALAIWMRYDHARQAITASSSGQRLWRTIATGVGQRKRLVLPDSSTVWLNNNTVIRLSEEDFRKGNKREIWLEEGEAYFEVISHKASPFIVYVDTLQTTVLGTSFTVEAYRTLNTTRISVMSGKVQVRAPQGVLGIVNRKEMLTYQHGSGAFTKTDVRTGEGMGWWNGRFTLDHADFAELSVRMRARYGVQLKTQNDRILHTSFSAGFNQDTPLKQVLEVLCVIYKTSYTVAKADNTIIIH